MHVQHGHRVPCPVYCLLRPTVQMCEMGCSASAVYRRQTEMAPLVIVFITDYIAITYNHIIIINSLIISKLMIVIIGLIKL